MRYRSSATWPIFWTWFLFKAVPFLLCFGVALLLFLVERGARG